MTYIPKEQRKTILFLSDDIHAPTGVGTVTRAIIGLTANHFNWIELAGLGKHPYDKQLFDATEEIAKEFNYDKDDIAVKLYCTNGYGDAQQIRFILEHEKIDAIMCFTDPHYWYWLFEMAMEFRTKIPLLYYHVWDNYPLPHFNKPYYESCDYIASISKVTEDIVDKVCTDEYKKRMKLHYIPHGINSNFFYKITEDSTDYPEFLEFKKKLYNDEDINFTVLFNNKNMGRKELPSVMESFNNFLKTLSYEDAIKCRLIIHTNPAEPVGVNITELARYQYPDIKIILSSTILQTKEINFLYNCSDVTINLSSAEGFGLATAESLMSETPIIAHQTGGLQDQSVGPWAYKVPVAYKQLASNQTVHYIYNDYPDKVSATEGIKHFYNLSTEERAELGKQGRQFMLDNFSAEVMCHKFEETIDDLLVNFKPISRIKVIKI